MDPSQSEIQYSKNPPTSLPYILSNSPPNAVFCMKRSGKEKQDYLLYLRCCFSIVLYWSELLDSMGVKWGVCQSRTRQPLEEKLVWRVKFTSVNFFSLFFFWNKTNLRHQMWSQPQSLASGLVRLGNSNPVSDLCSVQLRQKKGLSASENDAELDALCSHGV